MNSSRSELHRELFDGAGVTSVTLTGIPALKVYKIKESDGSNTIFAVTNNYNYGTALTATGNPYGDKGFVVIRKGGDAASTGKIKPLRLTGVASRNLRRQLANCRTGPPNDQGNALTFP